METRETDAGREREEAREGSRELQMVGGHVFISYRREGGGDCANVLESHLKRRGYSVILAPGALAAGRFDHHLVESIERAADVVVVLSPHSLDRCVEETDWVRREIELALGHGKNVVPVLTEEFDKPEDLPDSIAGIFSLQSVPYVTDLVDGSIDRLCQLLEARPRTRGPPPWIWLVLLVLALLLGAALVAYRFVGSSQPFEISTPRQGELVALNQVIRGTTRDRELNHYLVVTPLKIRVDYVMEGQVTVGDAGQWTGIATFGERSRGAGERFVVRALATAELVAPGPINTYPSDALFTAPVEVTRTP